MRAVVVAFLILVLAVPQLPGQTGPSEHWTTVLSDGQTDTSIRVAGEVDVPLVQTVRWTDLEALQIQEVEEGFTFRVQYYPETEQGETGNPTSLDVYFWHGDQRFWLDLYSREYSTAGAALAVVDETGEPLYLVSPVQLVDNEAERYYEAFLGRDLLLDKSGAPPFTGRELRDFLVTSYTIQINGGDGNTINDYDAMPDDEVPTGIYEVKMGSKPSGDLRLYSVNPSKASNGEAGTFVYDLVAENTGDLGQDVKLAVVDQPAHWAVEMPAGAFHLEAGESRTVPLLVSLPFNHQHGARDVASLRLSPLEADPMSGAALNVSILYYPVPQPAGHHNTLYLHTSSGQPGPAGDLDAPRHLVYMNTLEVDEADSGVNSYCGNPDLTGTSCSWEISLKPSLEMGMDWRIDEQGTLNIGLGSMAPMLDAAISGSMRIVGSPSVPLAEIPITDVSVDSAATEAYYTLPILPVPESDYVPFGGAGDLVLRLTISLGHPSGQSSFETPYLLPGGWMELPLDEYREELSAPETVDSVLSIDGAAQRRANPGDAILFNVTADAAHEVSVFGSGKEWATLTEFKNGRGHLIVHVPEEAAPGQVVDLVLRQEVGSDIHLARVVVLVDDTQDHPSDEALVESLESYKARESPAISVALAIAAILVGMLARWQNHRD